MTVKNGQREPMLLVLKIEERDQPITSQEMWVASRSWQGKGMGSLLEPFEEHSPVDTLNLAQPVPCQTSNL